MDSLTAWKTSEMNVSNATLGHAMSQWQMRQMWGLAGTLASVATNAQFAFSDQHLNMVQVNY